MSAVKKILTAIVSVLLWAIILLAALFAFTTLATRDTNKVANLAGYTPLTVLSDSMSPTFNSGDMIFIKTCNPDTLKEGDIVCFHTIIDNQYVLNTHRIVEVSETNGVRNYVTKGDNNQVNDQHIIANGDIVGKYAGQLPGFGKVMDFLASSTGFLILIVLPMLLFFIYQLYHLIMVLIEMKKATAAEAAMAAAAATATAAAKTAAEAPAAGPAPASDAAAEAEKARAEAAAALAEAQRMKAEAEAALAAAKAAQAQAEEKID